MHLRSQRLCYLAGLWPSLLVEHGWAQPLFDAIAETGGEMLGEGFLTAAAGLLVGAEVAAMEEAARVIAEAQAAEADAMLMAIAAEAQAAESIAESEAIRAAAAADAVRALITAGLLEEAAVHEAVEALSAAGLTIAAADEAAAASVAEYAEAVLAAGDATAEAVAEAGATVRAASITVAEARVLHYLPTPASFAVIGDKLGISREAARQRAERAYKKLGVHNRAEAVSRARALGAHPRRGREVGPERFQPHVAVDLQRTDVRAGASSWRRQNIAIGFQGEPVPPGSRRGTATTMNSQRPSSSQAAASSSSWRLSETSIPIATTCSGWIG